MTLRAGGVYWNGKDALRRITSPVPTASDAFVNYRTIIGTDRKHEHRQSAADASFVPCVTRASFLGWTCAEIPQAILPSVIDAITAATLRLTTTQVAFLRALPTSTLKRRQPFNFDLEHAHTALRLAQASVVQLAAADGNPATASLTPFGMQVLRSLNGECLVRELLPLPSSRAKKGNNFHRRQPAAMS